MTCDPTITLTLAPPLRFATGAIVSLQGEGSFALTLSLSGRGELDTSNWLIDMPFLGERRGIAWIFECGGKLGGTQA